MSAHAMAWAIGQRIVKDARARCILLCIASYADKIGRSSPLSVKTLSADTGLSERTVRCKLDALKGLGVLRRDGSDISLADPNSKRIVQSTKFFWG